MDGQGKRFNQGKIRYDLIPFRSLKDAATVFAFGATKYGDFNWQRGMKWSTIIASLERHLHALKSGEDFDPESGLFHISHLICNAMMLNEYHHIYVKGDDRLPNPFKGVMIGIDCDSIDCDSIDCGSSGFCFNPVSFSKDKDKDGMDFNIDDWRDGCEKAKQMGIEYMITSNVGVFELINNEGVFCYLLTTLENKAYRQAGLKRLSSLLDLK